MPLRQTSYGGECPLGKFKVDVAGGGGGYTADPLEACIGNPELGRGSCNYFRSPDVGENFEPAIQCMCPADISSTEARRLRAEYVALIRDGKAEKTKNGFWDYVNANHRK